MRTVTTSYSKNLHVSLIQCCAIEWADRLMEEVFSGLRIGGPGGFGSELGNRPALICATRPPSFSQRSMARVKRVRGSGDSAFTYLPLHGLIDLQQKRYAQQLFLES